MKGSINLISNMNINNKSNTRKLLVSVLFISIIYFGFLSPYFFDKKEENFLYTELQQSQLENGKYKRDGILWMKRKTNEPLNGLVYDFTKDGKKIEFGMLYEGHQHGIWRFFHENGQPSMENVYVFGEFKETAKKWDINGKLIENNY